MADKITSTGKPKEKEKPKEIEEIYIPPEKRQQIINDLRLFWMQFYFYCIKMEFQKITNFIDISPDNEDLPKFVTKNGLSLWSITRKLRCQ